MPPPLGYATDQMLFLGSQCLRNALAAGLAAAPDPAEGAYKLQRSPELL